MFSKEGELLNERNLTRERYEAAVKAIESHFVLDKDNCQTDWTNIEAAVLPVNREAAALEALVISYKASQ